MSRRDTAGSESVWLSNTTERAKVGLWEPPLRTLREIFGREVNARLGDCWKCRKPFQSDEDRADFVRGMTICEPCSRKSKR